MTKLIIEADLSSEELQVLIQEVTILHRDIFKKPLVLQQCNVGGSLPPVTEAEHKELMKALYPTDRSKTFRRQ